MTLLGPDPNLVCESCPMAVSKTGWQMYRNRRRLKRIRTDGMPGGINSAPKGKLALSLPDVES